MIISLVLFIIAGITCIYDAFFIIAWQKYYKEPERQLNALPFVSVLVAARDEEHNLGRCLHSLLHIDYPGAKMEILVGNDASSDDTLKIALEYAEKFPKIIKVHDIQVLMNPEIKGKANVLTHLCQKAKGDYYFFTDADIEVPALWVKTMLTNFDPHTGIITGITGISGRHALSKLQNIDWFLALGIVKLFSDMKMPVTSMGNNMVVTKEAYQSVGGYEAIPFSITEDLEIFKQILKKGFKEKHLLAKDVLCWSQPKESFKAVLQQRKRWMFGVIETPYYMVSVLLAHTLFLPAILGLFFMNPLAAIFLFISKVSLQSIFLKGVAKKAEVNIEWKYLLFYEFYSVFLSLSLMVYFIIPMKVEWKGRKY